jgi:hypothetical protein
MLSCLGENDDERIHIFATIAAIKRIIKGRRQFLDLLKNKKKK